MICPNCKQEIDNIGFCPLCGYEIVPNYFNDGKNLETKDMPTKKRNNISSKKTDKIIKETLASSINRISFCLPIFLLLIFKIYFSQNYNSHSLILIVIIPIIMLVDFINIILSLQPLKGKRIKTLMDIFKNP